MSVAELTAKRRLFAAASAGHWLDRERLRVYSVAALVCYAIYFGIWCVRAEVLKVAGVFPPGGDFVVFWSAAKLTLQGNALAAYDIATLHQLEVATVPLIATNQAVLPWFYPPTFLLFVAPFGLLPYWLAVPVFFGVSAAAFVWVVRRIVPWREAWLPSVAFPGIAVVLATGQNALLLAACGGLALTMLRARPVVAGMLLALLTLKPQLALMVPVVLVCARAWRALAAMTLTTLALAAAALGAFGIEAYAAFLHNAGFARSVVESGAVILARMPTIFALVKMLHGGVALAYALHLAVAVAATGVVVYAWRRPCAFALQASALLVATLLASAYLYDYDLAFLGLVIAWFGTHAWRRGWLPGERELLVLLWLLPMGGMLLIKTIGFQLMPVILLLALMQIARRIHLERASTTQ